MLEFLKKSDLRIIPKTEANSFILKNHYSGDVMPVLTKLRVGIMQSNNLICCLTLGYGTRPLHTIKAFFPKCNTKDYYEIGKMCLSDICPRNSETIFLSKVVKFLKQNTTIKYLFTWADGIVGKVGYVYQAFNMYYGGFIETDVYVTKQGNKIHPRTAQGIIKKKYGLTGNCNLGKRPNQKQRIELGLSRVKGRQFRYILPLNNKAKKELKNSLIDWNFNYPKEKDLIWKIKSPVAENYKTTLEMPFKINKTFFDFEDKVKLSLF